ncbi:kinase-like domain-containing protein [Irpex rosettiformis]|uniref:Kinase-like domain-containing protein n=1 Tax=Irpex rosettiformis TaxID=378272 RepID=A0ACB8U750_9APHY|nr:kinase-like domain-containing protein [Irpex rosettiformis]
MEGGSMLGSPPRLKLSDLELIKIVGKGAFGSVGVVKVKKGSPKHPWNISGAQMAIKIFRKDNLRERAPNVTRAKADAVREFLPNRERRNLSMLEWHPFIAGMYACLQDSKNLYLLTELGHLGSLKELIRDRGPLPTSVCRFYFANLVLALEFLHGNKLIHCDLKPENIVIGADGYLMICDLGISGFRDEKRNWNLVGTTEYTSPEALKGQVQEEIVESVDWWALACILYEMATAKLVFWNLEGELYGEVAQKQNMDLVRRIIACEWSWPTNMEIDPVLKNIVERMLHPDFEKRIGCIVPMLEQDEGPLKNEEIRAHRFVRKFPWKKMGRTGLVAPFAPTHVPDASEEEWHTHPLPQQKDVPGLVVVEPSHQIRTYKRERKKKIQGRQEYEE